MSHDLVSLLSRPIGPRILVVGDVMLDRYLSGNVERISPEAPIPLVRVVKQENRLGGAGSVASMLAALDVPVVMAAVVGNDPAGATIHELLDAIHVDSQGGFTIEDRLTTVKERLLGCAQNRHPPQMMRVDYEEDRPISQECSQRVLQAAIARLHEIDLVLVSDYSKGVCAGELVPDLIAAATRAGVKVLADPARGRDFRYYSGCACITPTVSSPRSPLGSQSRARPMG